MKNWILSEWHWIMPNIVLFDPDLKPKTKLLYCYLSSLCAKKWYCRAKNQHLADKLNHNVKSWTKMAKETISRMIKELEDAGYIFTKMNIVNNSIESRIVTLNSNAPSKKGIDETINGIDEMIKVYWWNDQDGIDETINSLSINNTSKNSTSKNTCVSLPKTENLNSGSGVISEFGSGGEEGNLKNNPVGGKEKNSAKKEKLGSYEIWEKIISSGVEAETQIDKARVLLYVHNTLRDKWKIRWEETFFKKVYAQFKKWIDYKDIILAMWTLHHNKFCNWEKWWRKWKWDISYLFDARWIDKAWKFEIDKSDSETWAELRWKLEKLVTLPKEFKSSQNSNKWVLEEKELSEEEKEYIEKNTVRF